MYAKRTEIALREKAYGGGMRNWKQHLPVHMPREFMYAKRTEIALREKAYGGGNAELE